MNFRLARDQIVPLETAASQRKANDFFAFFSTFELVGITKHLMTDPARNSEFCFPSASVLSLAPPRETWGSRGNKTYSFPKGGGKRGHIVAETLLLMTFPCARKLGNICCGHKMFLKKIRNIFVSRTQNLCPQQMLRARANGETFVPATMCPQQCVLVCQYLKGQSLRAY